MPHSTHRKLSLCTLVMFGLAYMTPIIVLGTFGLLANETKGHVPSAYLLAAFAMFFTALSYSKMAKAFPVAGSVYIYVTRSINDKLGFLAGWIILLDYLFLPMVIGLIGASFLHAAFSYIPVAIWIIVFVSITSIINVLGLVIVKLVNGLFMLLQCLVIIAFIILSIYYVTTKGSVPLFSTPFWSSDTSLSMILAGATLACYSFLGFDVVTTLTDDSNEPHKNIPRAILLISLMGGGIFIITSYFVQLAHPSYEFIHIDSAATEIAKNLGGDIFALLFLIGLIIGQFASGISAQATASKLLYTMGCDGVFPRSFFGHLNEKFRTPVNNILVCATIALIATQFDVLTAASFINFGAFLAFMLVNLSVINHFVIRARQRSGYALLIYLLFPLIGLIADFWLFTNLDKLAFILGSSWLIVGIIYLCVSTKGFRKAPPLMHFDE